MRNSYQQLEEMPPAVATATMRWILSLADTKHRMGLQFSHWVTGTPALEAAVGAAAITQDELGHARSLYGLLRHYAAAPESLGAENDLEARDVYYAPAALEPRWESWLQLIAANVVLDSGLQCAIAATENSTFHPLAGRTAKMLQEERFHRVFGNEWLGRLMARPGDVPQKLQTAVNWAWHITQEWLGPDDDPVVSTLAAAGILNSNVAAIRAQWLGLITPLLTANGLSLPEFAPNWATWNSQFRHASN
jgi:phenylacetate-CoA oxygenase PaaI subunit